MDNGRIAEMPDLLCAFGRNGIDGIPKLEERAEIRRHGHRAFQEADVEKIW